MSKTSTMPRWVACVEEQLRAALAESRVGVEYQPIVGLAGITALEALVRVPASEPSAASAVVQVAEQTGLIAGLEVRSWASWFRDVAGWQEQGVNTRVHINVTGQLLDPVSLPVAWMHSTRRCNPVEYASGSVTHPGWPRLLGRRCGPCAVWDFTSALTDSVPVTRVWHRFAASLLTT